MAQGYRPDIDGLRAVAVLAVIANHIDDRLLPSGHLGVDVFFVISGYVIALSLARQDAARFGPFLREFYRRRFKRLYPALVPCIALTALVVAMLNPTADLYFLKTGFAGLFGLANVQLYRTAYDYFAANQSDPFLHLWSLGVEEQFYLVFPALWFAVRANRRLRTAVFAALTLASVATFTWSYPSPASFYLAPFRAWELGAGALLAGARWRLPFPAAIRLSAWAVLAAGLIWPPGLANTLAVVTATGAVLAVGGGRALELGPVRYVGRLSYSLYLWHWPVLVFGGWTVGIDGWSLAFLIPLMFGLAAASYHGLERPLRYRPWPRYGPAASGAALAAVAAGIVALDAPLAGKLYLGSPAPLVQRHVTSLDDSYSAGRYGTWNGRTCTFQEPGQPVDVPACTLGTGPRVLVIGNSQAAALVQGFEPLLRGGRSVTLMSAWGAYPVPRRGIGGQFGAVNDDFWDRVAPLALAGVAPGDTVLLASSLHDSDTATLEAGLRQLSRDLASRGVGLAIVHGVPNVGAANCQPEMAIPQWFTWRGRICEFRSREETIAQLREKGAMLRELSAEGVITAIDLFDVFCPGSECTYQAHGIVLYRDNFGHPSVEAARLTGEVMAARLSRASPERVRSD